MFRAGRARNPSLLVGVMIAPLLASCASTGEGYDYDPFEPLNRKVHWFNDKFDRYLFEPVARGYRWITPDPLENMISNFVRNMRYPLDLVNNLLQGKPKEAGEETLRFLANTVLGGGGLFDPATEAFGLGEHNEDFGQTFAVWGIPAGPYLVLPFIGPSNLRDGIGLIPDSYGIGEVYLFRDEALWGYLGVRFTSLRADLLEEIESARQASLDFYVFTRNAYGQLRQQEIADELSSGRGQRWKDTENEDDLYDDSLYDDSLYDDSLYDDEEDDDPEDDA